MALMKLGKIQRHLILCQKTVQDIILERIRNNQLLKQQVKNSNDLQIINDEISLINYNQQHRFEKLFENLSRIIILKTKQMTDPSVKMDNEQIMINCPDGFDAPLFCWDKNKTSTKLSFLDQEHLICKSTDGNGFKTTLGTEIFTAGGRYYFQIFINKGQLIKIGVSRPLITNLDGAFCDTLDGWAIYNGQTRHNSNSTGPYYGTQLAAGDIIGVALDMVEGTLGFYKNGTYWGVAFKEEALMQGEMVAAVAPIYSGDQVTLRSMIKED